MSTTTSRVSLIKPTGSDQMGSGANTAYDSVLARNYYLIDLGAGVPTYTSGTRPSGSLRWTGLTIFESDTGNYRFWDGSKWALWGSETAISRVGVAGASQDGTTAVTTATSVLIISKTFNAVQNRRYKIDWCVYAEFSTAITGSGETRLRWAPGSTITSSGTLLDGTEFKVQSAGVTGRQMRNSYDFSYTDPDAEITIGLFAVNMTSGTLNFNHNTGSTQVQGSFFIRDWGAV